METPRFRFLCLHGKGTNAKIMETQIASFRAWLEPQEEVEFDFVDGEVSTGPAQGVQKIYPGPYRCYFDSPTQANIREAYQFLLDVIAETGPYNGIIGYSQGGCLAASAIIHHRALLGTDLFQCAVFIHSGPPFEIPAPDTAQLPPINGKQQQLARVCDLPSSDEGWRRVAFGIPTVHVLGRQDPLHCYCQMLAAFGINDLMRLVEHEYGHDIPATRTVGVWIAEAIAWAVGRVKFGGY